MTRALKTAIAAVIVLLMGPGPFSANSRAAGLFQDRDYAEKDEINQTYTLSPGAKVTINDIAGPVEIETWEGGTAEVHIVRSARTREELDQKKILIEQTESSLRIFTEPQHHRDRWDRVQVRQRVTLKLPRRVSLKVNDIAGHVRVGEIFGDLNINDVAGSLEVAQVNGSPHINDIAGSVKVSVGELGSEGLRINDIAGRLEVIIASGMNADLDVSDVSGHIGVDVPNAMVVGKIDRERYRGKLGNGGPPIVISDIAGSVTVRH
ncbi:MAG TPA: hypothetical protein VFV34_01110 [Blastocatellia bacterium]|nr:hypothetical protein [Blastocatellia bacterium]